MATLVIIACCTISIICIIKLIQTFKTLKQLYNQRQQFFHITKMQDEALALFHNAKTQEEADSAWIDVELLELELDRIEIKPPFSK